MVVAYLERIENSLEKEKLNLISEINDIKKISKENFKIRKVLEENNDPYYEAFTPRQVNRFNKRKIEELDEEQKELENKIKILNDELIVIENKIEEICEVINIAKEKELLLKKLGY